MTWLNPHVSKIYEALGAIGDNRIEFAISENEAKIYSSSKTKFYTVKWNDDLTQMMANDTSAYWQGKLSYPMIAILMVKGKIQFDPKLPEILKGIEWKEVNKKFKNDYDKTVQFVLDDLATKGIDIEFIKDKVGIIEKQVQELKIELFGKKIRPPKE
jgi:hypothetical protein